MEGETALVSSTSIDHKNDSPTAVNSNYVRQQSRPSSHPVRRNTSDSALLRESSIQERHTLPEIPHNPLAATVAHVVSRELGYMISL